MDAHSQHDQRHGRGQSLLVLVSIAYSRLQKLRLLTVVLKILESGVRKKHHINGEFINCIHSWKWVLHQLETYQPVVVVVVFFARHICSIIKSLVKKCFSLFFFQGFTFVLTSSKMKVLCIIHATARSSSYKNGLSEEETMPLGFET